MESAYSKDEWRVMKDRKGRNMRLLSHKKQFVKDVMDFDLSSCSVNRILGKL